MKTLFKTILTAILCASFNSVADTYVASTVGGGNIVLFDFPCTMNEKLLHATVMAKGGKSLNGCWVLVDNFVMVVWEDGDQYTYPANIFRAIKEGKKEKVKI